MNKKTKQETTDAGIEEMQFQATDKTSLEDYQRRIDLACRAVNAHNRDEEADKEIQLCDLLADLMHWADTYGVNFSKCERYARNHYLAEKGNAL